MTKVYITESGYKLNVASTLRMTASEAETLLDGVFEPVLGNPGTNGYVLSSTTAGVRSWVAQGGGGGDVDDLTTTTGSSTNMLRVAAAGGLEYRTTAQVLSDIGAAPTASPTFTGTVTLPTTVASVIKPASDSTTALQLANAAGTAVVTVDTTGKTVSLADSLILPYNGAQDAWTIWQDSNAAGNGLKAGVVGGNVFRMVMDGAVSAVDIRNTSGSVLSVPATGLISINGASATGALTLSPTGPSTRGLVVTQKTSQSMPAFQVVNSSTQTAFDVLNGRLRIYGISDGVAPTTPTNYESLRIEHNASTATIASEAGGTGTQRALVLNGATIRFDAITNFAATMGNSTKTVGTDAPADWVEVQIGGTTYYLPAYAA